MKNNNNSNNNDNDTNNNNKTNNSNNRFDLLRNDTNSSILSIQTALTVADMIRNKVKYHNEIQQQNQKQQQLSKHSLSSSSSSRTLPPSTNVVEYVPGMWQGGLTMLLCTSVLLPFRNYSFQICQEMRIGLGFPKYILTPMMVLFTFQSGLYIGSIYGSYETIQRVSTIPVTAYSPICDSICHDEYMKFIIVQNVDTNNDENDDFSHSDSSLPKTQWFDSWDPRVKTIQALKDAIETCRQRNGKEMGTNKTTKPKNS